MKYIKCLFLLWFSVAISGIHCENEDLNWVNVNDPLSWDGRDHPRAKDSCIRDDEALIACQKSLKQLKMDVDSNKVASGDVLLKHVLRQFLHKLNIELHPGFPVEVEAVVRLSEFDVKTLHDYLESSKSSVLRDNVRVALAHFVSLNQVEVSWLTRYFEQYQSYIFTINLIILPLASIYLFRQILGFRNFAIALLLAAFLVSCVFTYMKKYNEVIAEKFSRIKHNDDQCSPKGVVADAVDVLLGYVRIKGKSECLKKYEDLLIDPIFKMDPLHIVGEVLTTFLMSPFTVGGLHLNKFFNDFFIDTPLPLLIVKMIFLVFGFFYVFGYRLRTIFFTLEPARPIPSIPATASAPSLPATVSTPALPATTSTKPLLSTTASTPAIDNTVSYSKPSSPTTVSPTALPAHKEPHVSTKGVDSGTAVESEMLEKPLPPARSSSL